MIWRNKQRSDDWQMQPKPISSLTETKCAFVYVVLQNRLWWFFCPHACATEKMSKNSIVNTMNEVELNHALKRTHAKEKPLNAEVWTFPCELLWARVRISIWIIATSFSHTVVFVVVVAVDQIKLFWWRLGKFGAKACSRTCTHSRFRNNRDNKRLTY